MADKKIHFKGVCMNFSIERPWALYGLLLLIPAIIYTAVVNKKVFASLFTTRETNSHDEIKLIKTRIRLRIAFRSAAWCMLIFAFSGISWGTVATPVQRNGKAVSMVFDISYSMTARDCPNYLTRLEAASMYASDLLDYTEGIPVSAVLAKGSGITAVPLTEDTESLRGLLSLLSPKMMSSAGSNLGEGILTALKSFPRTMSNSPVIWLFTDGEENGGALLSALNTALRQGVSVVIIGFGGERETEIVAGDEKTTVKTALRSEKIRQAVNSANKKNFGGQGFKFFKGAYAKFIDATEIGSAYSVLSSIRKDSGTDEVTMSYEVQAVNRHHFFMILALLFFILSFIVSQFSPRGFREFIAVSFVALSFTSCSSSFSESKKILEGVWNWHQKDYNQAIADFSQSLAGAKENNDELIKQYALYGLSVTYLMQNENAAAIEKINELSSEAPDKIRFACFYNSGIIAQRSGDYKKASELFKNALLVNPSNVNAKINLELSRNQQAQRAKETERPLSKADEKAGKVSDLEKSIFNRIRENDQKQWKNIQTQQKDNSTLDY